MNWQEHFICVFESKNHAVMLYSIFENRSIDYFRIASTPCSLNMGCNYSLVFHHKAHIDLIDKEAKELNIKYKLYFAYKDNGRTRYKKLTS